MCTIELTALKFKAGESAKTDHKMRRPAHVQTELSEDIATQTRRMTKLPPNVLTGDPPLRYDDGIWDNPQGAFAWDRGAAMTRKSRDGRHQTDRSETPETGRIVPQCVITESKPGKTLKLQR